MKTNVITVFLLFTALRLFSQAEEFHCLTEDMHGIAQMAQAQSTGNTVYKSANGYWFPTRGAFRSLTVFVNIIYDQAPSKDPYPNVASAWNPDTNSSINSPNYRPSYLLNLFDTAIPASGNYNGVVTRFYAEASFNQLILLSDFIVVNIKQSQITPNTSGLSCIRDTLRNAVIKYINAAGGLSTCYGNNAISEYDKIASFVSGVEKTIAPDGKIDLVNFVYRNTTQSYGGIAYGSGETGPASGITSIKIGNQYYGFNYATNQCIGPGDDAKNKQTILIHEIGHLLLGGNAFHTSGGTTDNTSYQNTFIGKQQGGHGLFSHNGLLSCNGYERWRLGWKKPSNNAYPIASGNVNSDVEKFQGEKTFVLQDFVTCGDVIRIKLPYKDTDESPNQYIWLENHQPGINNSQDGHVYSDPNTCRYVNRAGIYAYYQVGRDIIESTISDSKESGSVFFQDEMDNLRIISAEGNYNVVYEGDARDCLNWGLRSRFGYTTPNPLQGINDQNEVFKYNSRDNTIVYAHMAYMGIKNKNNVIYSDLPYLGDCFDAFAPDHGTNSEIRMDISGNPSPVNTVTCYSKRNSGNKTMTVMSTSPNTRKIYLTGLSIKMTLHPLYAAGLKPYYVTIRWDDYDVKQDVNWAGDIVLKEQLNLLENKTVILEQNLTPNQLTRDSVSGVFAPPTRFTCENGSLTDLAQNSKIIVKDKSTFIMENGATLNIRNGAEIIVEAGSTLMIRKGGKLNVYGTGKITVKPGAYICVEPGANIYLQGSLSIISIQTGARLGANPALFDNASCRSYISYTGSGKIILPINGASEITCTETAFSSNDSLPGAAYNWTSSPNISITTAKNIREIKAKGLSYNAANSWIKVAVTHNGQTYTETKPVTVNIPAFFNLVAGEPEETSSGKVRVKITATPYPEGVKAASCRYTWSATGGDICTGCAYVAYPGEYVGYPSVVLQMMDEATRQVQNEVSAIVGKDTVRVKPVAKAAGNLSPVKSAVLEITTASGEATTTAYVTVEANKTSISSLERLTFPGTVNNADAYLLTWNNATLTYTPGNNVTVNCHITGCNMNYSASLTVVSWSYTPSYTPSTRSIRFTKDPALPSGGAVHTYRVQLFNDSGCIRTDTFTSNEETVLIPLNTLPNGNYYINVLDEQGNIVVRKLIPVY